MKKKRYIVLLIILAIYVIAMYFFLGANHLKKEKDYTTILVGDSTIWNYSNKKWLNVTSKSTIKDINWKEFTVYIDNKKLEELLHRTRFNSDEAVLKFASKLKRLGIDEELKNLGAVDGDTVKILDVEFTYNENLDY